MPLLASSLQMWGVCVVLFKAPLILCELLLLVYSQLSGKSGLSVSMLFLPKPPIIFPLLFDAFMMHFATPVGKVGKARVPFCCFFQNSFIALQMFIKGYQRPAAISSDLKFPGSCPSSCVLIPFCGHFGGKNTSCAAPSSPSSSSSPLPLFLFLFFLLRCVVSSLTRTPQLYNFWAPCAILTHWSSVSSPLDILGFRRHSHCGKMSGPPPLTGSLSHSRSTRETSYGHRSPKFRGSTSLLPLPVSSRPATCSEPYRIFHI